jgi:hypothetical protein
MGKTQTNHTTVAVLVNIDNFIRAETDMYFGKKVQEGGLGQLFHSRQSG